MVKRNRQERDGVSGNDVIRFLGKKKYTLRDDGRCWLYAVMATLKKMNVPLKVGKRLVAPDPTKEERQIANEMCQLICDYDNSFMSIMKEPDYDGLRKTDDFMGEYGGEDEWMVLAKIMNLAFVLWNPKDMDNCDAKFPYINNDGKQHTCITANEIKETIALLPDDVTVVHVAWNMQLDAHFDVYL